jgi:filamentous hemagglutinin
VVLGSDGIVDVSAPTGGGQAGAVNVQAQNGTLELLGTLRGTAGEGRRSGSFTLDAAGLAGGSLRDLDARLNAGSFNEARSYRLRTGDVAVDGAASARTYRVTADQGSITVTGAIDASGATGGSIDLAAAGSLVVAGGARLRVAGQDFSSAGQGGRITLTAGAPRDGVADLSAQLDVQDGSTLDLSVASAQADSAFYGRLTGTVHLRAPRLAGGTDLAMAPIAGTIINASSILAEGFQVYDLTATNGTITSAVQGAVRADAETFLGAAGVTTDGLHRPARPFAGCRSARVWRVPGPRPGCGNHPPHRQPHPRRQ